MPIASFHCPQPIRRRHSFAPRDHDRRDRAIALFEAGEFAQSVRETFGYLLPELQIPDLASEALCFVQGSARVRARIEAGRLHLSTLMAALNAQTQSTAVLRFFLTRLSATGQLFQPRLRGDTIALEFDEQLSLLHPLKLIEVLQRLPLEAYRNDSWMVEEFGVEIPDREPLTALDEEEFSRAEQIWRAHWDAIDQLMTESRRRLSVRVLDALGSIAANQISYTLPLFGVLRARLNESADDFTNSEESPHRRDTALAKCIKQMRQTDAAQLRQCLGHASYAINPLQEGTPSLLTSALGSSQSMQATGELRAAGHALEAALMLIAGYLYLLAHFSWPPEVEQVLRAGLDQASGKPWREAADALWNHANQTARVFGSHGEHDGDEEESE